MKIERRLSFLRNYATPRQLLLIHVYLLVIQMYWNLTKKRSYGKLSETMWSHSDLRQIHLHLAEDVVFSLANLRKHQSDFDYSRKMGFNERFQKLSRKLDSLIEKISHKLN